MHPSKSTFQSRFWPTIPKQHMGDHCAKNGCLKQSQNMKSFILTAFPTRSSYGDPDVIVSKGFVSVLLSLRSVLSLSSIYILQQWKGLKTLSLGLGSRLGCHWIRLGALITEI